MQPARLPDGFGIRIDPRVRTYSDGRVLIGGSPTRMLQLAPTAAAMIGDGYLEVCDQQTAVVARRLLDSGVANPRPMSTPSPRDVTVVVPVKDNPEGLVRLLGALHSFDVVVVDDGSTTPVRVPELPAGALGSVTVLRHDAPRGPAAARNTGLRVATTPFVAFLDSDVVPHTGWAEVMLGHFSDPSVALVAPRIVALVPDRGVLGRYEHARSSLDLGRRESAVASGGPVSYVPSAAMIARRDVLAEFGGFDHTMHVAEDVDLCWRLQDSGWRLRYEPVARVAHDHRVRFGTWFSRKMFYGTGAAPLATRHDGKVPPVAMSPWTLATCLAAGSCTRAGLLGALAMFVATIVRLRRTLAGLDQPTRVAAILAARGFSGGMWQLASAACRHYWPVTLLAVVASRRVRRIALTFALAEGVADWVTHREAGGLGPVRHTVFKRLDDLAYGSGLWRGALTARTLDPLKPRLRS
ncbi:mycofactocin biosynthesis glycosyltransferase MftF [Rhodococcus sp. HNM0569]|uniref:mycofactocin biosynthesis glycosyltransferase MftF n=1 Tax=Rhodococcus sp. HNM0569 TaxID=2716340 RepID=UPI00146E7D45|nr:mycofactocin biosynthesis glycosyltransferase MftF [Rhodococcus sp. HNM0569]NLU81686.1 mycofactocin system glycosyltransferase [Rhodococcus sp. HNM0569]